MRTCQFTLCVIYDGAKKAPLFIPLPEGVYQCGIILSHRFQGGSQPVPSRHIVANLSPPENPGNSTQIFELQPIFPSSRDGPGCDRQISDMLNRSDGDRKSTRLNS